MADQSLKVSAHTAASEVPLKYQHTRSGSNMAAPYNADHAQKRPRSFRGIELSAADLADLTRASSTASTGSAASTASDNLIDEMEKEQEGIVLRLMKEIQALKEENRQLKLQLSKQSSAKAASPKRLPPIMTHSRSRSSSNSNAPTIPSPLGPGDRRKSIACTSLATFKRMPSFSGPNSFLTVPQYQHTSEFLSSFEQRRRAEPTPSFNDFTWKQGSSKSIKGQNRSGSGTKESFVSPMVL